MPEQFTPGQRWISSTETDLGLGIVTAQEGRTVTLEFAASGERRTYARDNAPLTRAAFSIGDWVETADGVRLRIDEVRERNGLLHYHGRTPTGTARFCPEGDLSDHLQLNRPLQRLLTGQFDSAGQFRLRQQTRHHLERLERSHLLGLGGARTELLPHQIYIAHEAGRRPAPRVLLADEVGLGKTIEACLILHRQLLSGRASRVLVLVPEPLLHQWLVELLRRFNLRFSILDEERCQAIQASGQGDNPFLSEQLVLCSLSLFAEAPRRMAQVLDGEWDLLIVDEAHHLAWSEEEASLEYRLVEALATDTPALLLLTATPEQLGRASHFARLRLLDPDRFHSLEQFEREQAGYEPIAEAVDLLLSDTPLPEDSGARLLQRLGEARSGDLVAAWNDPETSPAARREAREELIAMLLDRHGTGRVLFRNTRRRIIGFPRRELHLHPHPLPEEYAPYLREPGVETAATLTPERLYGTTPGRPWWGIDPRVGWLVTTLRRLGGEKVLLICAHPDTARDLGEALRRLEGIDAGLFHEGMSIIQRDRTAAWFADPLEGCQLMICSEIGSEGRNFQFAHHLVLFDLPLNPDLLQQRIGRLDRIGQRQTIQIHLPYFEESPQETLLQWYHQGLDAFLHSGTAGQTLFQQLAPLLLQTLEEPLPEQVHLLIEQTRQARHQAEARIERGRDHLLEINSCRQPLAETLCRQLEESTDPHTLADYSQELFTHLGLEVEEHSSGSVIIRPGTNMLVESIPGLPADGLTGTFQRHIALSHEERHFLSWEHPLIRGAMELVTDSELGNCCVVTLHHPQIKGGGLLLDLAYQLECAAPRALRAGRFLPGTRIRLLIDQHLKTLDDTLDPERIDTLAQPLEQTAARRVINALRQPIGRLAEHGEQLAGTRGVELAGSAIAAMCADYTDELQRLEALRRVNPTIRGAELEELRQQAEALHRHLEGSRVRLDALRLIITT
ncbi:MAG: RNA polymerase-associated protein RapA [gamma proteobacterium symbiont of Phacoides pectinatus]